MKDQMRAKKATPEGVKPYFLYLQIANALSLLQNGGPHVHTWSYKRKRSKNQNEMSAL